MAVVYNPNMPKPKANSWTTELFDMCAEPGGAGRCIYTMIFPGCAHGEMAALAPPTSGVPCAGNCYGACCLWGCFGPLFTCISSGALRTAYGIPPDMCADIVAGVCTPCGIMQQHREVTIRKAAAPAVVMMMPTITAAPAQPMMMAVPGQPVAYAQPQQVVYAQPQQVAYAQPQQVAYAQPQQVMYAR